MNAAWEAAIKTVVPIQALRAVAAISIAVLHGTGLYTRTVGYQPIPQLAAGIDLFFVISGFVMVYSSDRLFGQPHARMTFLTHRIARIVPLYWAVTVIALLIFRVRTTPAEMLCSLLFIPHLHAINGSIEPYYGPGWTLNYEMFFYSLFAIGIGFRRVRALAMTFALIAIFVVIGQTRLSYSSVALFVWSNPITLEFLMGMALAIVYQAGIVLPVVVRLVGLGVALALLLHYREGSTPTLHRVLFWGLPAAMIVAASTLSARGRRFPGELELSALGDASYSIYLFHPIIGILFFLSLPRLDVAETTAMLVIYLAVTVALAMLSYARFERPMTRMIRTIARPSETAHP